MAIKVRVLQKPDDSFIVQRETADGSNSFTDLPKTFNENQEERARDYADKQFHRINRPNGSPADMLIYQVG